MISSNNRIIHTCCSYRRSSFRMRTPTDIPPPSSPNHDILIGSILLAGAFAVSRSRSTPVKYIQEQNFLSGTTSAMTVKNRQGHHSIGVNNMPVPTFDIGSLGGLPTLWGLPYNGENPGVALVMASAGVTIRMIVNLWAIYFIYVLLLNRYGDDE